MHTKIFFEHFIIQKKHTNDFCKAHNKSTIGDLRKEIKNTLCKCIKHNLVTTQNNHEWISTTCTKFGKNGKCDFCSHIITTDHFLDKHKNKKFRVHGLLKHDYAPIGCIRWFVYVIIDIICEKYYTGSTNNPVKRWSVHKSEVNCKSLEKCKTALTRHFIEGCPGDQTKSQDHLKILLVDYHDVTEDSLKKASHKSGPGCKCTECIKLKTKEVNWMLKTNSISEEYGLNSWDEIAFILNK